MTRKGGKAAEDQAELRPAPVESVDTVPTRSVAARKAAVDARKAAAHKARQRVAVIIPAKDESRRIAATVRSARAIPHVDLVLVVDDGSEDNTQHVAREAGAVVVRHSHNRGKAAAMETGAAVVAMRDAPDRQPRILLFIDGDLGETAVNTAPLVPPVFEGHADLAIALHPAAAGRRWPRDRRRRRPPGHHVDDRLDADAAAVGHALPDPRGVRGGDPAGPRLGRRDGHDDRPAARAASASSRCRATCKHRPSGSDLKGQLHRAAQYRDVQLAVNARRVRRAAGAVKRTVTPVQKPPQTHR